MRFSHVIFDCDGVLVDTESIAQRVEQKIFQSFGVEMSLSELDAHFTGKAADVPGRWLIAQTQGALTLADFEAIHAREMLQAFQQGVQAIPYIAQALAEISKPKSCATNGIRERATFSLTHTNLIDFFQGRLHTVEDVKNPKPAPDIYHLAAAHVGLKPEDCVVIEDSPSGVMAAASAGMEVLGFVGLAHDPQKAAEILYKNGARAILTDMRALPTALDWL